MQMEKPIRILINPDIESLINEKIESIKEKIQRYLENETSCDVLLDFGYEYKAFTPVGASFFIKVYKMKFNEDNFSLKFDGFARVYIKDIVEDGHETDVDVDISGEAEIKLNALIENSSLFCDFIISNVSCGIADTTE